MNNDKIHEFLNRKEGKKIIDLKNNSNKKRQKNIILLLYLL